MTQPVGNCPGCGGDQPFEQIHAGVCPDTDGECPEWACVACGAAVIMGTVPGTPSASAVSPDAGPGTPLADAPLAGSGDARVGQNVRAA
jgi:hypothetical protein